jgi:hypothetical protein
VQIIETRIVATTPHHKPEALKAAGIANIPLPKDDFSRWVKVPQLDTGCSSFLDLKGSKSPFISCSNFVPFSGMSTLMGVAGVVEAELM